MLGEAAEDYLKAIWRLTQSGRASTTALAAELEVAPASVTGMLKKLAALRLVEHEPYRGARLTSAGERVALEVVRHHRLLELYLTEALGFPTRDPHGGAIPAADGAVERTASVPMTELEPGQSGVVCEVSDHDPALLRYVGGFGLYPEAEVRLVDAAPFDGPLTIRVGRDRHVLGREAARHVRVAPA